MEKTTASACIVVYGGGEEAAKAARSLIAHTQGVSLTLTLVDNASPDGSGARLLNEDFGEQVRVVCLPRNVGFGSGHNTVLPTLESKYHFVVNPDITVEDDAVSTLCAWMDKHPDVVMATPRLLFPDGREQYTAKRTPSFLALLSRQVPLPFLKEVERHYQMRDEDLTKPQEIGFCTGCFFVIRTDVFRKMGGFDEGYFMYVEDADITRKAQSYGKVMYVPAAHVFHAWHRDANKKWKNFWMQVRSMFRYWRKWGFQWK